jgi:hypothetical protein
MEISLLLLSLLLVLIPVVLLLCLFGLRQDTERFCDNVSNDPRSVESGTSLICTTHNTHMMMMSTQPDDLRGLKKKICKHVQLFEHSMPSTLLLVLCGSSSGAATYTYSPSMEPMLELAHNQLAWINELPADLDRKEAFDLVSTWGYFRSSQQKERMSDWWQVFSDYHYKVNPSENRSRSHLDELIRERSAAIADNTIFIKCPQCLLWHHFDVVCHVRVVLSRRRDSSLQ